MTIDQKISIGGIIVAVVTIIATVQTQIGAIECSEKAKTISEVVDLATQTITIAKYRMNITSVCIKYTGKAELVVQTSSTDPNIPKATDDAFRELQAKGYLMSSKLTLYYASLDKSSPLVPDFLREISSSNLSGSFIKSSKLADKLNQDVVTFTQQCDETPVFHNLWREMDIDLELLTNELSKTSLNCSKFVIWGKLFQILIIGTIILIFSTSIIALEFLLLNLMESIYKKYKNNLLKIGKRNDSKKSMHKHKD